MDRFYRYYPIYTLILSAVLFFPALSSAEMIDKVVAVVNNDVITLSELNEEVEPLYQKIEETVPLAEIEGQKVLAREDVLDAMIDKRLIDQKAKAQNITVSQAEIDSAFEQVMKRAGLSQEQLLEQLADSGLTEEGYRSTLESQILQNKLVGTDVTRKIIITDEMMLDYYDDNYTSKVDEGSYYLLQMGFGWDGMGDDSDKGKKDARQRAERIHKLASSGQDFQQLAKKFSDLPSAEDGGDIGTFFPDEMSSDMRKAIVGLTEGELSSIIETSSGYQFFKVLTVGQGAVIKKAPYEKVKNEIKAILFEQEMDEAYREWVRDLKEGAYIQKL